MILLLLLFACLPAAAAITDVRVEVGTQQTILHYYAPDTTACTHEVSTSATYSPLVNDVNAALFSGANSDARAGSFSAGRRRAFVIGKRATEVSSGTFYSRSLQTDTTYYFRITCGADTATGSFKTANIAWGNTYREPAPVDTAKIPGSYHPAGYYAFPTLTHARNQEIIDPQTGTLHKRMTIPRDHGSWASGSSLTTSLVTDVDANWTTPNNILVDDTNSATSTGGQHPLLYHVKLADFFDNNFTSEPLDSAVVVIKGNGAAAAAGDRTLAVCLTLNASSTCWSNTQTVALPQTTDAQVSVGNNSVILGDWVPTGDQPPSQYDLARTSGTVNTSGTAVTWVSGYYFSARLVNGSRILINGVVYTVSAFNSPKSLTLTATAGTQTGVAFSNIGFTVKVVKNTASADAISIQFVRLDYLETQGAGWPSSQAHDVISPNITGNGPSGNPGYLFANYASQRLYWIDTVTGDAAMVAPLNFGAGATWQGNSCAGQGSMAWHTTDPYSYFCTAAEAGDSTRAHVVKVTYNGAMGDVGALLDSATMQNTTCTLRAGGTGPCGAVVDLTPATHLKALMTAAYGTYDGAVFGAFVMMGGQGAQLLMVALRGSVGQDAEGWVVAFDTDTATVKAVSTWGPTAPMRWCVSHTCFAMGAASNPFVDIATLTLAHYSTVTVGTMTATPSIAAGTGNCPTTLPAYPSTSVVGCDQVTVNNEPQSATAVNYQNAAVGDIFCANTSANCTIGGNPAVDEYVMLVFKSGLVWTVARAIGNGTLLNHPGSIVLSARCSGQNTADQGNQSAQTVLWNLSTGAVYTDMTQFSHPTWRDNVMVQSGIGTDFRLGGWLATINVPFPIPQIQVPKFAGAAAAMGAATSVESHPSVLPTAVATGFDGGPFLQGSGNSPFNNGAASLVGGTTSIYRIAAASHFLNRKLMATYAAGAGQNWRDTSPTITDAAAGWFTYCVAAVAAECNAASAAGDLYFNTPLYFFGASTCTTGPDKGNPQLTDWGDVCFANMGGQTQAISQIGYDVPDKQRGFYRRILSQVFARNHQNPTYDSVRVTPDGRWLLFARPIGDRFEMFAMRLPSPAPLDSVVRGEFIKVPIQLPGHSAPNARIKFGYAEYGAPGDFRCTSRQQACVTDGSAEPFKFTAESQTLVTCSSGCTLTVNAIPGRVLYFQVERLDTGGNVLATGHVQTTMVQ